MTPEQEITALYRALATGEPGAALDTAILRAAHRRHQAVRELGTLAALAASLIVAVVLSLPQPQPKLPPETATYGLYEGKVGLFLRDPEAMQQSIIRSMPAGAN